MLACCESLLRKIPEAKEYLGNATALDKSLPLRALEDPDLSIVWNSCSEAPSKGTDCRQRRGRRCNQLSLVLPRPKRSSTPEDYHLAFPWNRLFVRNARDKADRETDSPLVIFGQDTSDNPITVHRCVRTASHNAEGIAEQTFIADAIFVGAHLLDPDQELFGSIQLEFDYLFQWLGQQARVIVAPHQEIRVVNIRTEFPHPVDLELSTHGRLRLTTTGGSGRSTNMNQRLDTTRWSSHIWWQFPEHNSVLSLDHRVHALRRLFTLFIGHPVHLRAFTLFRNTLGMPQIHAGHIDNGVEVLRARRMDPERLPDVWGSLFTVTYEEVRQGLAVCISRWFEYHTQYKTVLDLYFSEFFGQQHPMQVRFLLLAQALEVYHGIGASGQVQPKARWRSRIKRIVEAAPSEERDWLK
jgi:ApeA N-terminal domain 1